jgi:CheY-like chemotaxis protein
VIVEAHHLGADDAAISVLIVDDEVLWRRIIKHTLEKRVVVLSEASSVAEAADALRTKAFDLVIVDYELPDGYGLDLLDEIDRNRFGRLVLATGHADPQDLNDDRCDLVDRVLTKPFLSSDLSACLDDLTPAVAVAT